MKKLKQKTNTIPYERKYQAHAFTSEFKRHDEVDVVFPGNALLKGCFVTAVIFKGEDNNQPFYDVLVPYYYYENAELKGELKSGWRHIHGLEGWFLRRPEWNTDPGAAWYHS